LSVLLEQLVAPFRPSRHFAQQIPGTARPGEQDTRRWELETQRTLGGT
jgi:hypothetical protein